MYVLIERHGNEIHPMTTAADRNDAARLVNQGIELYCAAKNRTRDYDAVAMKLRYGTQNSIPGYPGRCPVVLSEPSGELRGWCRFGEDELYEITAIEIEADSKAEKPLPRVTTGQFTDRAELSGVKKGLDLIVTCQAEYRLTVDVPQEYTLEMALAYVEANAEKVLKPGDESDVRSVSQTSEVCEVLGFGAPNIVRAKSVDGHEET